ncbi:MAG: hypothetical protein ACRYE8_00105 [Janthinobacterium lividum]
MREDDGAYCMAPMSSTRKACLRGSKSTFDVMPWLDHGIQKIIKNTNFISIF